MSYTPDIIMSYDDLMNKVDKVGEEMDKLESQDEDKLNLRQRRVRAMDLYCYHAIFDSQDLNVAIIKGISVVMLYGESIDNLTSYNKRAREILDELGIEYGVQH